jgi:hypothetical protein
MQGICTQIEIQTNGLSVELDIPEHWCAEVLTLFNEAFQCCVHTAK